jgi:hypothetical protein
MLNPAAARSTNSTTNDTLASQAGISDPCRIAALCVGHAVDLVPDSSWALSASSAVMFAVP